MASSHVATGRLSSGMCISRMCPADDFGVTFILESHLTEPGLGVCLSFTHPAVRTSKVERDLIARLSDQGLVSLSLRCPIEQSVGGAR
jgi:hypothetical protein